METKTFKEIGLKNFFIKLSIGFSPHSDETINQSITASLFWVDRIFKDATFTIDKYNVILCHDQIKKKSF